MNQKMFPEATAENRAQLLQDNATSIVNDYTVTHKFTKDELAEMREEHSDVSIKLSEQQDELDAVKVDFKTKMAPAVKRVKQLLTDIKNKYTSRKETVYLFADQKEGMMSVYDIEGELVDYRRLLPEERQSNIFPIHQQTKIA